MIYSSDSRRLQEENSSSPGTHPSPATGTQPPVAKDKQGSTDEQRAFHKTFLQADFYANPEFMTYEHYKPHLGRIEYLEVGFNYFHINISII